MHVLCFPIKKLKSISLESDCIFSRLYSCMTLGKLHNFSKLQFPHLKPSQLKVWGGFLDCRQQKLAHYLVSGGIVPPPGGLESPNQVEHSRLPSAGLPSELALFWLVCRLYPRSHQASLSHHVSLPPSTLSPQRCKAPMLEKGNRAAKIPQ